jgi:hypothetical protein
MRYVFFFGLFILALSSCAQSKYGIKKIIAFYAIPRPGNIPVDEKGNEIYKAPDTVHVIYIEMSSKNISWQQAWLNNKNYGLSAVLIQTTPMEAGINSITKKRILLQPSIGNSLWQIQLVPAEKIVQAPQNIKTGEILLMGQYGNKIIFQKINSEVKLLLHPSV